jgi:hypothetical protein
MSHVSAGGAVPGWLGIAVPWVLSVMVCTILAGRKLSLLKLSVAVVVSQLLFHTLFVLGTVSTVASGAMPVGAHAHVLMPVAPVSDATAIMVPVMVQSDLTMWLMHGLAAMVTVAALYRGERAVLHLRSVTAEFAGWMRRRLVRAVPVLFLRPFGRLATDTSPGWHVAPAPHLTLLRRRGPPLLRVV